MSLVKKAIKLHDSYNIKYNYYIISNDEEFKRISNSSSSNTFPQIFINNEFIGGYSELEDLSTSGGLMQAIH